MTAPEEQQEHQHEQEEQRQQQQALLQLPAQVPRQQQQQQQLLPEQEQQEQQQQQLLQRQQHRQQQQQQQTQQQRQRQVLEPHTMNAYEHLKNLWLAFALVNALLISSSTSALTANVVSLEASNISSVDALSKHAVYGVLWGVCLICNVWALTLSITGLGLVLNERTNDAVIEKFGSRFVGGPKGRNESRKYCVTMMPSVFTSLGAIFFAIASSATACYKYGHVACLVTVIPSVCMTVLGISMFVAVSAGCI